MPKQLLLVGGGHAQLGVLADLVRNPLENAQVTLVNDGPYLRYSGMVPGIISGQYAASDGQVALEPLCRCAGVRWIEGRVERLDPGNQAAILSDGTALPFDIASVATGGVGRATAVFGAEAKVMDIRPIERFVEGWEAAMRSAAALQSVLVIGGGAGGVEIAFALRNAAPAADAQIAIVTGDEGLLPGFGNSIRSAVSSAMRKAAITEHHAYAAHTDGVWTAGDNVLGRPDLVIAAIGSTAPEWPRASGLDTDGAGYILVDAAQRSISHPHIFATGDVAVRADRQVNHSGVHAVHAGKALGANLRDAMAGGGGAIRSYRPRPASLYLLSTGDGSAIGSYGPLSFQGRWVARLKRYIDAKWVDSFAQIAATCNR